MAFSFNGTLLDPLSGSIVVNNTKIDTLIANGQLVWYRYKGPSNPITITESCELVAGVDFPANIELTLCMCGGGQGGSATNEFYHPCYSGRNGEIISGKFINLVYGESVSITIGAGGHGISGAHLVGIKGGDTSFGSYATAKGGEGKGQGDGESFESPCGGTYHDGYTRTCNQGLGCPDARGGIAGAFGNGGNGGYETTGGNGGIGAGGGASFSGTSGKGGRGQIVISW